VFRWDINVRESAVLGLVGGGGLGMALDTALSNLYWDQAGLVLFRDFRDRDRDRDRHLLGAQPDYLRRRAQSYWRYWRYWHSETGK